MSPLTRPEIIRSGEVATTYHEDLFTSPILDTGPENPREEWLRIGRANHLKKLRHLYPIPGPIPDDVIESTDQFIARDGANIAVKIYPPIKVPPVDGSPLIMMYHEGGWCLGDLTDEDLNCRMFAKELGAVCVNVDYRLAPEHPFPIGVHDCWDALKWAISHATSLKANPRKGLVVGGASAGGNLSAVMALLSRDEKLEPPITGQFLSVPALLSPGNVPPDLQGEYKSRSSSLEDPVLKGSDLDMVFELYKPDPHSPLWDPFNHPNGLAGVAKTYFQVAGLDPLRDEAVLYERALRREGVPTKFHLYGGYGHMFWTNYPELEESKRFVKDSLEGMRWLLEE